MAAPKLMAGGPAAVEQRRGRGPARVDRRGRGRGRRRAEVAVHARRAASCASTCRPSWRRRARRSCRPAQASAVSAQPLEARPPRQTTTRRISSIEVWPAITLRQAVVAQRDHPLLEGHLADRQRGGALDGEPLDLLAHRHHLVQREPALVAGLGAGAAADGAVERRAAARRPATGSGSSTSASRRRVVRLLALRAEPAGEALGQHAVERRADEEGLDAHLGEADDRPTARRWCAGWRARGGR